MSSSPPANPEPEIKPQTAHSVRSMAIDEATAALNALVAGGSLPAPVAPPNRQQRRAAGKKKPPPARVHTPDSAEKLFAKALASHQAGNLLHAAQQYKVILDADAHHADALHMSGVLACQTAQFASAVELIAQAIKLKPAAAHFHASLGVALCNQSRTEEGIASYQHALSLKPDAADTHYNLGNALRRAGRTTQARQSYMQALAIQPNYADAHNNLGITQQQLGQLSDAIQSFRLTLQLAPDYPGGRANLASALTNRGNELLEAGRAREAAEQYREATGLKADFAPAHQGLGNACLALGGTQDALAHFQQALAIDPSYAEAHNNAATLLRDAGQLDAAIDGFTQAIALKPALTQAQINLGAAFYMLLKCGQGSRAVNLAEQWVLREPANAIAAHALAALRPSDNRTPERAADAYVEALFDGFAGKFDDTLARLDYRAPAIIYGLIDAAGLGTELAILDAGCGTGLSGVPLRARARHLVGVDLSTGMLGEARRRHIYDELHRAELTAFMAAHPGTFDLVVAADVLIYFGSLSTFFNQARAALKPGGSVAFAVEVAQASVTHWELLPSGRYAHTESYLRATLAAAGLTPIQFRQGALRTENGIGVPGYAVLARLST